MSTLVVVVLGAAVFTWLWWRGGGREEARQAQRVAMTKAGEAQRASLALAFSEVHAYRAARPADWVGLDRAFFARSTEALASAGFVPVGDIVDDTMRAAFPRLGHVLRVFLGDGGRTRIAAWEIRGRGLARVWQLVGVMPRKLQIVECVTEVDGGARFVSTAASLGIDRMTSPPEVDLERLPPTTAPLDVLARHRARLEPRAREVFVVMAGLADVLRSVQRGNVVVARFRAGVGPLTEAELIALRGRPLTADEEAFLAAVRA